MSNSILGSTKKALGVPADYTAFDVDIVMHINTAFSTLGQLGIGPVDGFQIENDTAVWDDFLGGNVTFNFVKTYMFIYVKLLFDPPTTSYHLTALKEQKEELEWRINVLRESTLWITPAAYELDGGNEQGIL